MGLGISFDWLPSAELLGAWVAVILTLCVFSFLLADNALYRLAEHLFVGVAVGYGVVVVLHRVILPKSVQPVADALSRGHWDQAAFLLIPPIVGLLLLASSFQAPGSRRTWGSWLASPGVALLLGVGAALAIGGALTGTLLPQVDATADLTRAMSTYGPGLGLFSGLLVLVGTIGVLLHFRTSTPLQQTGRPRPMLSRLVQAWGRLGWWLLLIAFAAILASTFVSRLSILVERIQFLLESVPKLLEGWR